MKTLLVILSHSGANETVRRHWPWYIRAECDILGVGRENTNCVWPVWAGATVSDARPEQRFLGSINVGVESGPVGDNHIKRFLDVLGHIIGNAAYFPYSHVAIVEYDVVVFRAFPVPQEKGMTAFMAGGREPGSTFLSERFWHCPWTFDMDTAITVYQCGQRMLKLGLIEHGFIDRFLGLLVELHAIPVHQSNTYTQNTIYAQHVPEVRQLIREKQIWMCHGVKTPEILKAITEGL